MIVTLKKGTSDVQMNEFISSWEQRGFGVHVSKGESLTILGLLGDTSSIDTETEYVIQKAGRPPNCKRHSRRPSRARGSDCCRKAGDERASHRACRRF